MSPLPLLSRCALIAVLLAEAPRLQAAPPAEPKLPKAVFRFSQAFFASALERQISHSEPVQLCILGVPVRGHSLTEGRTTVEFHEEGTEAHFDVVFVGVSTSSTVGHQDPVRIHGQGVTTFRVSRRLAFDERQFLAQPAVIAAQTRISTRAIETDRRLGRRLILRVAARRVAETKAQVEAISLCHARARILDEFNRTTDDMVRNLNANLRIQQTIETFLPADLDEFYTVSTTRDYLQVAIGGQANLSAVVPDGPAGTRPPLEIWLHGSLISQGLPLLLSQWDVLARALQQDPQAAALLGPALDWIQWKEPVPLRIRSEGEWIRIQVHATVAELAEAIAR